MSTPYFLLGTRQRVRNQAKLQVRLGKQRLACLCGGTKDSAKMIVCLDCFRAAPLALQRDAYSRSPEVRRTAARQLLARALSKRAERQLNPGGEPTTACNPPQRLKASPAPAGVTSTSTEAAQQCGPAPR